MISLMTRISFAQGHFHVFRKIPIIIIIIGAIYILIIIIIVEWI